VVVLENIFRRNKMGLNAHDAAIEGSKEVGLAVAASTLTSVVVYLPIALSGGMVGMLFRDFSFTIVAALGCSLLVSLTVVPMLASNLLDNTISEDYIRLGKRFYRFRLVVKFTKFIEDMTGTYRRAIKKCLANRAKVIIVFLLVFALSGSLLLVLGSELIPAMDEGGFTVTVEMPHGTSLAEHDAYMAQIEEYLIQQPEVEHISMTVGEASSLLSSSNVITANLVPSSKRSKSTEEVMRDTKRHFKDLAGAEITYAITDSLGMTALAGADLTINVYGDDARIVANDATELYKQLQTLDCISDIETDVAEGSPEVRVKINRSTAAYYGLTTYQVASELSSAISGTTYSRLNVDGETIDIELSLSDKYTQSVEDMKAILINTPIGMKVPVGQIASFEFANSPVSINKSNQEIVSKIDLTFKDSVSINKGTSQATAIADKFVFSDGVRYETGGMKEQMTDYFQDLVLALVVSIALVFIVMAAQFESVALPFMVMFSIPFAMSGAFLALFLTGQKLSIIAMIGFIMLVGIVVNNAILLVEFISQNKEEMGRDDAITEAGAVRMRPILMTTVTTIVGMIPMALGIGEATEMMIPMAVSVIGGLIASTATSLFIVPVMYSVIDDWEIARAQRNAAKKKLNLYRETLWLAKEAEEREERIKRAEEKRKEREERQKAKNS
ncbi:MAG: efflux RND transporter permease subunit, partial [Firmicutes bacterium]|nr:efflux RND transporter permease subunit [Bacillota bacterium]